MGKHMDDSKIVARAALAAFLLSTALGGDAFAQTVPVPETAAENASNNVSPDEIVVTAQKRVQNLQDVPVSIQVLNNAKLDQLQVQNFQDYVRYLPSVSISGANPGGNATVVTRGIATDGGNYVQGSLPTVGIYLDEQPITTINGAVDLHIYDIARVEALSGPQGTIFGASSEAGTIRIISNKPDPHKLSAGYDLEVNQFTGHDFGGQAQGFVNIPLSDRAALRVVAFYDRSGGYIQNLLSSRTYPTSGITVNNAAVAHHNYNPVDTWGGRAALAIELDDHWTITPSVIGQVQLRNGSFSAFPAGGPEGALVTQRYDAERNHDAFYQAGLTITGKVSDLDFTYAGTYFHRDQHGTNDYADYSYFYDSMSDPKDPNSFGHQFLDQTGKLIDPTQTFVQTTKSEKITQEARLATPAQWRLRGLVGVFWQEQTEDFRYDYQVRNLADSIAVRGNPGAFYLDDGERVDRDFAVFTQEDFDITKKLTFTAGARYYRYNNSLADFNGTRRAFCIGPTIVGAGPCTTLGVVNADGSIGPVRVKGDGVTYRFNGTYKFNRDHLVYATISDGFRPGGANSQATTDKSVSITYGAEDLTNYEIGTKNSFLDRHATLDLTLFWEKWNNIQLAVETRNSLTGTGGIYTIQNAGNARSRGVELDFSLRPLAGLSITSASTYTDAILTKTYNNGFGVVAPSGEQLPFTPRFKTNLIGRYEFALGGLTAHVQGAEVYQTSAWNNFETRNRDRFGKRRDDATTDASIGARKGNKTFELYVTNMFDSRGFTSKIDGCGVSTCKADRFVFYSQPRLVGLRLGQKF